MPFSIDELSIKSESQKVKLNSDSNNVEFQETNKDNEKIFMLKDLVEQDPITIF